MSLVSATVKIDIAAPRGFSFEHIVPIDLPSIFIGYGPLPAVTGTRDQTGAWDGIGQRRTVLLSDGSQAQEELTAFARGESFQYTVSHFTGPLRFLVRAAHGQWRLSDLPGGGTRVQWRYTFDPRFAVTTPVVAVICKGLWRSYMKLALRLCKEKVESHAAVNALLASGQST